MLTVFSGHSGFHAGAFRFCQTPWRGRKFKALELYPERERPAMAGSQFVSEHRGAVATKHVALFVETSRSYGRDLLRGIHRWIEEHEPWSLFLELRALDSQVPRWLAGWQGDGIIARTASTAMAEAIAATGLPGVELRASKIPHGLPFVGCDNRDIGRLVADHFIDNGFRNFAVFYLDTERYFEERRDLFRGHLASRGYTCHEHHSQIGRAHV